MQEALEKIKHYCAYSERCHSEVRYKLLEMKVYGQELEQIIAILIEENFLNEERYARAVARGKFRLKQWGRNKIRHYLNTKQVSPYLQKLAMQEIDEDDYLATLERVAEKKANLLRGISKWSLLRKLNDYLLQKGYEYELIAPLLKKYS